MGTENVKKRYEVIRDDVISGLFERHISPKVHEETGMLKASMA